MPGGLRTRGEPVFSFGQPASIHLPFCPWSRSALTPPLDIARKLAILDTGAKEVCFLSEANVPVQARTAGLLILDLEDWSGNIQHCKVTGKPSVAESRETNSSLCFRRPNLKLALG